MATSFAHSGAILDDRMTGFSQVVNSLDEGSAGSLKDLVKITGTTFALDAKEHHGKEIRIAEGVVGPTLTMPATFVEGFKVKVVQAVESASGAHSFCLEQNSADTTSYFVGSIDKTTVSGGADISKVWVTQGAKPWEAELEVEAVEGGKYKVTGSAIAGFDKS